MWRENFGGMRFLVFLWEIDVGRGQEDMYYNEVNRPPSNPRPSHILMENKIKTKANSNCSIAVFKLYQGEDHSWKKAFDIQLIGGVSVIFFLLNYFLLKTHSGTWDMTLEPDIAASISQALSLEAWGLEQLSEIGSSKNWYNSLKSRTFACSSFKYTVKWKKWF